MTADRWPKPVPFIRRVRVRNFQPPAFTGRIPLVCIEEPETALHPATVNALYEALDDASAHTQVIVTSRSSDLLTISEPHRTGQLQPDLTVPERHREPTPA